MNRKDLVDFLTVNGKFFVQFFCVLFGVIAQECYQILRHDNYHFKKVLPKLILAWFVCTVVGTFITESSTLSKFYPILIMLFAFLHRQGADWLMNDFFKFLLKYISTKGKKDE